MSTQLCFSPGCIYPHFYLLSGECCRFPICVVWDPCTGLWNQLQTQISILRKQTKMKLKSTGKIPTFVASQCWDEAALHCMLCLFLLCLKWLQGDWREF